MTIERDSQIRFHELGTLNSVTRWIRSHDEGLAEWLKNARRAYQNDRANVADKDRAALLLFKDGEGSSARIGLLDVGGASLEDVERWSTWQDPEASSRGSSLSEEETQGNGGKAYMYRLFGGPAEILGIKGGRLNRKGMEGKIGSLDRGIPGFIPDTQNGRNREVSSWEAELKIVLDRYDVRIEELPSDLRRALERRRSFTLVEGASPTGLYGNRIDVQDLIRRLLRHDQSTLAVQQLRLYAAHNGSMLNQGQPLSLEPIAPFPGFEQPIICQIPEELPDEVGRNQSTTQNGQKPIGRLTLHTLRENMWRCHKELRSRWRVSYRAGLNMIGSKLVSELVPTTPGKEFVYATVELESLEPDYVALGRIRPNDGPLIQALDIFVADRIRELAKQINEQRRQELDETQLDEVQAENRKLDEFKNRFLPDAFTDGGDGPNPGEGDGESEIQTIITDPPPRDEEKEIVAIEVARPTDRPTRIAHGVSLRLGPLFRPRAVGPTGNTVPRVRFNWTSSDRHVIEIINGDTAVARKRGCDHACSARRLRFPILTCAMSSDRAC